MNDEIEKLGSWLILQIYIVRCIYNLSFQWCKPRSSILFLSKVIQKIPTYFFSVDIGFLIDCFSRKMNCIHIRKNIIKDKSFSINNINRNLWRKKRNKKRFFLSKNIFYGGIKTSFYYVSILSDKLLKFLFE